MITLITPAAPVAASDEFAIVRFVVAIGTITHCKRADMKSAQGRGCAILNQLEYLHQTATAKRI